MKNIPIAVALVASIGCTYILLMSTDKNDMEELKSNAVSIQIGVFKSLENATNMQERLGGYVVKVDDVYRVYYGILDNDEHINYITNYLTSRGISYYINELFLTDDVKSELDVCEQKMNKEKLDNEKLKIMFDFIKNYEEVI